MYVWFDALTNYISTLGWPEEDGDFKKFWTDGHTLQLAGKDQIRFQSIMWQAMLKSAGVAATDQVFYHGFINSGGHKMSKSLGNVISPYELVEKYGTDATRYILLRHVHPVDDSDLTWEKMDGYYTDNLVNGLGNLVARIMKMAETHLRKTPQIPSDPLPENFNLLFDKYSFNDALNIVWNVIDLSDGYIQEYEPFKLVKTDKDSAIKHIGKLVVDLSRIAKLLEVVMPETSEKILKAIKANKKPDTLLCRD